MANKKNVNINVGKLNGALPAANVNVASSEAFVALSNKVKSFYYADLVNGDTLPDYPNYDSSATTHPVDGSIAVVKKNTTSDTTITDQEITPSSAIKLKPYVKVNLTAFFAAADAETLDEGSTVLGTDADDIDLSLKLEKIDADSWKATIELLDGESVESSEYGVLNRSDITSDDDVVVVQISAGTAKYVCGSQSFGYPSGVFKFSGTSTSTYVDYLWLFYSDYMWRPFGHPYDSEGLVDYVNQLKTDVYNLDQRVTALENEDEDETEPQTEPNNNSD